MLTELGVGLEQDVRYHPGVLRLPVGVGGGLGALAVSSSSSSLSLVNSILSDQQSRGTVTDRVRLPTPPLIEPCYKALAR